MYKLKYVYWLREEKYKALLFRKKVLRQCDQLQSDYKYTFQLMTNSSPFIIYIKHNGILVSESISASVIITDIYFRTM